MKIVGKTTDGKWLLSGVFTLFDTHGFPLEMAFEECKERNLMPDWFEFYDDATSHGWKHDMIISRLSDSLTGVWSSELRGHVIEKLEQRQFK